MIEYSKYFALFVLVYTVEPLLTQVYIRWVYIIPPEPSGVADFLLPD